jgi:uncharacterized membrane protein
MEIETAIKCGMEDRMNKEIFLRDLRRFLADMPEEEREQALKYYEDYFEDAGPENEQNVIQELGSPIEVAKQIKGTNQENIAYGQGNDFQKDRIYPNVYENVEQARQDTNRAQGAAGGSYQTHSGSYSDSNSYTQNSENYYNGSSAGNYANGAYQNQNQKKSWTQDSSKIALVIVLAVLAIPVGIPILSAIFALLVAFAAIIFSLIIVFFSLGGGLAVAGIGTLIGSFFTVGGIANVLTMIGIGLILTCVGIFIFWFGILFCIKFFPALVRTTGKLCCSIAKGIRSIFS